MSLALELALASVSGSALEWVSAAARRSTCNRATSSKSPLGRSGRWPIRSVRGA